VDCSADYGSLLALEISRNVTLRSSCTSAVQTSLVTAAERESVRAAFVQSVINTPESSVTAVPDPSDEEDHG